MFYTETYCPGVADFDRDGKLAYEAILRILENTASRHSDSSGDDVIDGSRRGITWVLTDWRVEIVRRPQNKAPLQVATWVRDNAPVGRVFRAQRSPVSSILCPRFTTAMLTQMSASATA